MVNQNQAPEVTYVGLLALILIKGTGANINGYDISGRTNSVISHDLNGKLCISWTSIVKPNMISATVELTPKSVTFTVPPFIRKKADCLNLDCFNLTANVESSNFGALRAGFFNTGVTVDGDTIGEIIVI